MQKAGALLLILFLGLPVMLFAQEDSEPSIDDWEDYVSDLYSRGDQTFIISLGVAFPVAFISTQDGVIGNESYKKRDKRPNNVDPPIGGTGMLSYNYYLNSYFFLGGELGLIFFPTIANNVIYIVSLGARFGAQYVIGRFEFPAAFTIGMTLQKHSNSDKRSGYFGMYLKGGLSAFFRATHEWSFGITSNYYWYPQWTNDRSKNVDGHFVDLILSARYHF
ncbi:MAG: hypothetical protein FWB95_02165 [Treponema sp.]|nr:hypothetical protein [Treponema sp.]